MRAQDSRVSYNASYNSRHDNFLWWFSFTDITNSDQCEKFCKANRWFKNWDVHTLKVARKMDDSDTSASPSQLAREKVKSLLAHSI